MQRPKETARDGSIERKLAKPRSASGKQNGHLNTLTRSNAQVVDPAVKANDANHEKRTGTEKARISFTSSDSAVVDQDPENHSLQNDTHTVASGIYSLLEDERNKLMMKTDTGSLSERENENATTASPSSSDDFVTARQSSSLTPQAGPKESRTEFIAQLEQKSFTRVVNEDEVKCEQDVTRYPQLSKLSLNDINQTPAGVQVGTNILQIDTTPWGIPIASTARGEATSLLAGLEASDQAIASLDSDRCTFERINARHSLPTSSAKVKKVSDGAPSVEGGRRHSSLRPEVRISSNMRHGPDAMLFPTTKRPRVSMVLPRSSIKVERSRSTPVSAPRLQALPPSVHLGARREASVGHTQVPSFQLRKAPSRLSLARLFPARVEQWGAGVLAGLLYAPEVEHDGHGSRGLRATLLAGLSTKYVSGTLVRRGDAFTVRVVGTHLPRVRRGFARVAYSAARAKGWAKDAAASVMTVHMGCAGDEKGKEGYKAVPHGDSLVAAGSGGVRVLAARFVLAETRQGAAEPTAPVAAVEAAVRSRGTRAVDEEVAWEIAEDGHTTMRRGALPLRFGYYFVLGEPSAAKLYCVSSTPEHLRLIAVAAACGGQSREVPGVSRMLAYMVIRVSEA